MNVMSTARDLLTKLEAESWRHGLTGISRVHIKMGALCEIVPDALTSAFQALADGTVASGAELSIRLVSPKSLCERCGTDVPVDKTGDRLFCCAQCGRAVCEITSGRDLDVVLIRGKTQKPTWIGPLKQQDNSIASRGFALQEDMGKCILPE